LEGAKAAAEAIREARRASFIVLLTLGFTIFKFMKFMTTANGYNGSYYLVLILRLEALVRIDLDTSRWCQAVSKFVGHVSVVRNTTWA
jgi:hypothetical protein